MKGWIGALALLSLLALCHADTDAEMGGAAAEDTNGLSAIAAATVGDYGPDPNAQIITDESGGTAVVLSNQNSVHEQTDDTWKIHLVREARRKTKEENKRKNALEEKRKQSYEEANKQDQEEEKLKDWREKNMQKRAQDNKGQGTLSPSEGPQASTTGGGAQSEPIAAPVPMKDICTFSKDAACDTNFENRGLAGMLMRKDQYSRNPFNEGGDFNTGWKWTHPYLCCGTSDDATLSSKFILAKTCPPGSSTVGFSGALLLTQGYETNNVFAPGGDFNTGWKWTHPLLCQVNDVAKVSGGTNWCLFAAQCPGGKWTDKGFSGVIVVNEQYDKQPFHSGGAYNAQWKWAHPRLCCRMSS